jgi:sortase A
MRSRVFRVLGLVLIVAGVASLAWTVVVWQWQDPFTGLYTRWEQRHLSKQYATVVQDWKPPRVAGADRRDALPLEAAAYRSDAHAGNAIGKIVVGRLGLNMVLVDGTDEASLKKGPGLDARTYMPGENRLVYVAGHRTTYLAPFAHINEIRAGDYIRLEMPYATFVYRATGHMIVPATALWVLRSPKHELLRLQACHPRFFATHRYIVNARLVRVEPRAGVS